MTVETHVLDFDRELYGEKIRVRFLHRLRGEHKFESVDALRAQIESDSERAVKIFSDGRRCAAVSILSKCARRLPDSTCKPA